MQRFSSRLTELGSFAHRQPAYNTEAPCDILGAQESDLKTRTVFVLHS